MLLPTKRNGGGLTDALMCSWNLRMVDDIFCANLLCFNLDFILDTDASGEGLGTVLSQVIDGHEHVIAYASQVLSKSERKYCATRREMLALVWATHHFRPYEIYTQHKS